jgi:hypothetical protein
VARKTNDLAVASLVCGGLSFMVGITAIPAIITGHMALSRLKHSNEDGRGLAITGLILGYTVTAGAVPVTTSLLAWRGCGAAGRRRTVRPGPR